VELGLFSLSIVIKRQIIYLKVLTSDKRAVYTGDYHFRHSTLGKNLYVKPVNV
jgi:hypothetical protein|tara:strand:+ start:221 stop:379 length:159 start_codon:yes stop_codon:yes gene_type:complete